MIISIDFDGTIVEHEYPAIGKTKLFAFETLKALQNKKHTLILWTFRAGRELEEAVNFCKKNGLEFYAVNRSFPEENALDDNVSRKINADVFIDDRNLGGFPGWSKVWELLEDEDKYVKEVEAQNKKSNKKGLFSRLFGY